MRKPIFLVCLMMLSLVVRAQVPALSSYPAAAATVFLDFDGHYVKGTSWNALGPITTGPANLSPDQITEIFERVSEDYRPFNLNITTDSTIYLKAPATQRIRLVLTVTSEWYGSAGGVSYIGSFIWGDNTPAFVFTALLNYNTKNIAEAASHEIGHTLGLRHQSAWDGNCTKLSEYNSGNGSGEIGWAPIMGVGYYRNLTLWNNGANPFGCTYYQDDLGIISGAANGFGFRADDNGNSIATATPAIIDNNRFTVSGVIEKITDQDLFQFDVYATSLVHIDANPYSVGTESNGSDLDMEVSLINRNNTVLSTYNPAQLLGTSIDTVLKPGTYYLRVQGRGNQYAPEYASLGSYQLKAVMIPGSVLPVRTLELKGEQVGEANHLSWTIVADEKLLQQEIEVSRDGRNFTRLVSASPLKRDYLDQDSRGQELYYRIQATFDNGNKYYSNIIRLGMETASGPVLRTRNTQGSLSVSCRGTWLYTLTDYRGRTVQRGTLVNGENQLELSRFARGLYILSFSNGGRQYTEKIIRQ